MEGEKYEGEYLVGVYKNKRDAIKKAFSMKAHFGDWEKQELSNSVVLYLESGCDYVQVLESKVE